MVGVVGVGGWVDWVGCLGWVGGGRGWKLSGTSYVFVGFLLISLGDAE